MKTNKKQKFSLDKFEVAKLTNLKTILGGVAEYTGDIVTVTKTSSDCVQGSTRACAGNPN